MDFKTLSLVHGKVLLFIAICKQIIQKKYLFHVIVQDLFSNIIPLGKCQPYLHLFVVFFDKNLVKYIFGIMEYSSFGIL